jgi:hypothetical protein
MVGAGKSTFSQAVSAKTGPPVIPSFLLATGLGVLIELEEVLGVVAILERCGPPEREPLNADERGHSARLSRARCESGYPVDRTGHRQL